MITLIQWNGSNVTPADDAALYAHFDGRSGIISGCVPSSLGSNQIAVSSGRGYICGRQFTVQQETILAQVSSSGEEMQGRLLVQIDLANSEQPITFLTQAAASLPDLVQDDLNNGGTVYQLPLATYTIDSVAISGFTVVDQQRPAMTDVLLTTVTFQNEGVKTSGGSTAQIPIYLYKIGRIVFCSMFRTPVLFSEANTAYSDEGLIPSAYRPIQNVRTAAPSLASDKTYGSVFATVQTNGTVWLMSERTAIQEAAWSACWISAT